MLAARRQPHRERPFVLSARGLIRSIGREQIRAARAVWSRTIFDRDLMEKLALMTLIVVIFAQTLPNTRATTLQIAAGSAVIIILNTALSHWLARRGMSWKNAFAHFLVMAAANITIVAAFQLFPGRQDLDDTAVAFFILLLSLIITLLDRFLIGRCRRQPP